MELKYFVETAEGNRVGPYSLSEVVQKFGDNATLIPADQAAQIQGTDSPDHDGQALPSYPTQLELPKMPKVAVLSADFGGSSGEPSFRKPLVHLGHALLSSMAVVVRLPVQESGFLSPTGADLITK